MLVKESVKEIVEKRQGRSGRILRGLEEKENGEPVIEHLYEAH